MPSKNAWENELSKGLQRLIIRYGEGTTAIVTFRCDSKTVSIELPVKNVLHALQHNERFYSLSNIFEFETELSCAHIESVSYNNKFVFFRRFAPTPEEVVAMYKLYNNIAEVARRLSISQQKCKRILMAKGKYPNPYLEQFTPLLEQGKSIEEISKILEISRSAVFSYLPYKKQSYCTNQSANALKILKCRKNKNSN